MAGIAHATVTCLRSAFVGTSLQNDCSVTHFLIVTFHSDYLPGDQRLRLFLGGFVHR